jgi:hypothetical protein
MIALLVMTVALAQDAEIARRLDDIVARLGSDVLEERDAASAELHALGTAHRRALAAELTRRWRDCAEPEVRGRLALALGRLNRMEPWEDAEVLRELDAIVARLGDERPEAREAAAADLRNLSQWHGPGLVPALKDRLKGAGLVVEARLAAQIALLELHRYTRRSGPGLDFRDGEYPPETVDARLFRQRQEWEAFVGLLMIAGFALYATCTVIARYGGRAAIVRPSPVLPGAWRLAFGPRFARPARTRPCKLPC